MSRFRIVLYGPESVGKSSLALRRQKDVFDPYRSPTLGAALLVLTEKHEGREVKVDIWDTAGSERFSSVMPIYFRNANLVFICFDRFIPVKKVDKYRRDAQLHSPLDAKIYLVVTKIDLAPAYYRLDEIERYAETENLPLFYTSSATGDGIDKLFSAALGYFIHLSGPLPEQTVQLEETPKCCIIV